MTAVTVTFDTNVDRGTLHDLFVTACEGGINYWADVVEYHWSNDDRTLDLEGFYAIVVDKDDERRYRLDAATLRDALVRCAQATRDDRAWPGSDAASVAFLMLVAGRDTRTEIDIDYDALVADAIAQVAMLGEVVYG